ADRAQQRREGAPPGGDGATARRASEAARQGGELSELERSLLRNVQLALGVDTERVGRPDALPKTFDCEGILALRVFRHSDDELVVRATDEQAGEAAVEGPDSAVEAGAAEGDLGARRAGAGTDRGDDAQRDDVEAEARRHDGPTHRSRRILTSL